MKNRVEFQARVTIRAVIRFRVEVRVRVTVTVIATFKIVVDPSFSPNPDPNWSLLGAMCIR